MREVEEDESVLVPGSNETALAIDSWALLMEPAFPIYQWQVLRSYTQSYTTEVGFPWK